MSLVDANGIREKLKLVRRGLEGKEMNRSACLGWIRIGEFYMYILLASP